MKKITLIVITFVMTFAAIESFATDKSLATDKTESKKDNKREIVTVDFLTDIDCDHCAKKIMNYMPYQKGVKDVKIDLPGKVVSVSYDNSKSSDSNIINQLKSIDVTASIAPTKE